MEAIRRALECAVLAGKLRMAAQGKDERTAASPRRAADRFSAGAREALAKVGDPALATGAEPPEAPRGVHAARGGKC